MPQEFKLPDLGENITAADVLNVLVKVGDEVAVDQPVLEIETDKATIEVPSGVAGKVTRIHVEPGQKAKVGEVVLTVEGSGAPAAKKPAAAPPEKKAEEKPAPEPEKKPEPVAARPAPAPVAAPPKTNGASRPAPGRLAPASPTVRRLAREIGIDINAVKGSGPAGRISHDDVKAAARTQLRTGGGGGGMPVLQAAPLPDFSKFGPVEREEMNNIRKATARQMGVAWSTVPMVTQFDRADITDLEILRGQLQKRSQAKLTVTAILLKIVASALKKFPKFNASLDLAKSEVVFKKYFHVGVAVDTERGLVVPVIRDVDRKNALELAGELGTVSEKARARKLTPDDMSGACFTISNLGGIGGTNFTPIVNPPEVAILGVARGSVEPFWFAQENQFRPRTILPLSLSYDHRLIDGADGARFLRWICQALENPGLLAFEG